MISFEQNWQQPFLEHLVKMDQKISRHSVRVSRLCVMIGNVYGFSEPKLEMIRTIGLLHDVGKIALPQAILNKPTRLSNSEYEIIQSHTWIGGNMLTDAGYSELIVQSVKNHHERLDGSGYPGGLGENQLCLMSRIIAVADVYEAMITDRPYRKALTTAVALDELRNAAKYDQIVTEALVTGLNSLERTVIAVSER